MNFQNRLIQLRKDRNISQEKLAEQIGISRQSVAKWETGETLPEIEKLIAISKYFMVSIDSLLKDENECTANDKTKNPIINYNSLVNFLCKAKKVTYAGHGAETESSRKRSHDLIYKEDSFMYYDTYLGGRNFSGEEAVWKDDFPIWAMNYSGRVLDDKFSGDFLKEALSLVSEEMPFRGPLVYHKNHFSYHCMVNGQFEWFNGSEEIFYDSIKVYECFFHGGIIKE